MNGHLYRDALGWGFILWLIGYAFGIALFAIAPAAMIGWIILPIGTAIALAVLFRKVSSDNTQYYGLVAVAWTVIAIVFDYVFIVKLFHPPDGYYKLDVYLYYVLTFALPLLVGWLKATRLAAR